MSLAGRGESGPGNSWAGSLPEALTLPDTVHIVGAGRMGEGIARAFAFAGIRAVIIDVKKRTPGEASAYAAQVRANLAADMASKVDLGRINAEQSAVVLDRISLLGVGEADAGLKEARLVFEAVPEVLEVKAAAFAWLCSVVSDDCLLASTSSSFPVAETAALVTHPGRLLNAHWLNPADLVPLVEISRGELTAQSTVNTTVAILSAIGKVPVVCSDSAGYIVPRLQVLVMNEAARMVEEGVATAAEIDNAVRVGFGFRFAVLGPLEFIDWGGGDILFHAANTMSRHFGDRFEAPEVVRSNMKQQRTGLRDGAGFYEYDSDVAPYRRQRMLEFWRQLDSTGLSPQLDQARAWP
jgi:3-hydroxybutyryl-CoA dehydrogenase